MQGTRRLCFWKRHATVLWPSMEERSRRQQIAPRAKDVLSRGVQDCALAVGNSPFSTAQVLPYKRPRNNCLLKISILFQLLFPRQRWHSWCWNRNLDNYIAEDVFILSICFFHVLLGYTHGPKICRIGSNAPTNMNKCWIETMHIIVVWLFLWGAIIC
jgi:hypothetical protein